MADNVAITAGAGTSIASDDIGGVHWQRIKVGWGADGVAGDVSATNPLPVSAPAATRATHHIGITDMIDSLMDGFEALLVKRAFVNVAASSTDANIVTAVASKRICVVLFRVHCGAAATSITFNTKPGGAGSAISELFALGANGGHSPGYFPKGHFQTGVGEGLSVTTTSGSTIGVGVAYVEKS